MSRKVHFDELLDLQQYEQQRDAYRRRLFEVKRARRIDLGPYLTLLFENADTVRYQVQEMVRSERMVARESIEFEIRTYNELLGDAGQIGCSLLIGVEDPVLRRRLLSEWLTLPEQLYVGLADGTRIHPTTDERQQSDARVSAVQFLIFDTGGQVPTTVGSAHPGLVLEMDLDDAQRAALEADLQA